MVALQSIRFLLLFVLLPNGSSQTCGFRYLRQPPTILDCNPFGMLIKLLCSTASSSDNVTWYWTQNVSEAGVSGTAILPGDTSGNYQVSSDSNGTKNREINFTASESTLGYYWCEISNAVNVSLRPSTITPVCPPMSSSQQNKCTTDHIRNDLHHDDMECAEENSSTVICRPPLPTSCAVSPTLMLITVASSPTPVLLQCSNNSDATMTPSDATMIPKVNSTNTITTTTVIPTSQPSFLIPAVVTFCVLVVVLVVVLVIITAVGIKRRKSKAAAKKGGDDIKSHDGPKVITQQPSLEMKKCNNELAADPCTELQEGFSDPVYNKLILGTTASLLPDFSIDSDPTYSRIDLLAVSQTQVPATFNAEDDGIVSIVKAEHKVPTPSSGVVESSFPIYAQPDLSKKHSRQKKLAAEPDTAPQEGISNPGYSKLARETTTFPLPATSINDDPTYSHFDLPAVSQKQMPATFDPEYDETASTMKLEQSDKLPVSAANMAANYDDFASEVVPKTSYKYTSHPFGDDAPVPKVNVHSLTHNELSVSRTNGEEDKSNNRSMDAFNDPSYTAPPLISSDNGNNTRQFQLSGYYEDGPHFQNQ